MHAIHVDSPLDDDARRNRLYDGDLFVIRQGPRLVLSWNSPQVWLSRHSGHGCLRRPRTRCLWRRTPHFWRISNRHFAVWRGESLMQGLVALR
jgi:hypothetical protein